MLVWKTLISCPDIRSNTKNMVQLVVFGFFRFEVVKTGWLHLKALVLPLMRPPVKWIIKNRAFAWTWWPKKISKKLGDAGDWTPGLSHAKRTLYHWATSPMWLGRVKAVFSSRVQNRWHLNFWSCRGAYSNIWTNFDSITICMVAWPSGLRRWF